MLEVAIEVGKVQITWLEALAFVLALACVVCNVLEVHWGWPLAIISSAMYFWLFFKNRLYGDSGVQVYFVLASAWGWWQWLRPDASRQPRSPEDTENAVKALQIRRLTRTEAGALALVWLALWGLMGVVLSRWTDSDVAWADAFPTAGSLIGQVLLGRKILENWVVWQLVNISMVGLLAWKGLWLTMVLYGVFLAMAVLGWRRWSRVSA